MVRPAEAWVAPMGPNWTMPATGWIRPSADIRQYPKESTEMASADLRFRRKQTLAFDAVISIVLIESVQYCSGTVNVSQVFCSSISPGPRSNPRINRVKKQGCISQLSINSTMPREDISLLSMGYDDADSSGRLVRKHSVTKVIGRERVTHKCGVALP
jgi:hypothetical protein